MSMPIPLNHSTQDDILNVHPTLMPLRVFCPPYGPSTCAGSQGPHCDPSTCVWTVRSSIMEGACRTLSHLKKKKKELFPTLTPDLSIIDGVL